MLGGNRQGPRITEPAQVDAAVLAIFAANHKNEKIPYCALSEGGIQSCLNTFNPKDTIIPLEFFANSTPTDRARLFLVADPHIKTSLARLLEAGHIETVPELNRRYNLYRITESGLQHLPKVQKHIDALIKPSTEVAPKKTNFFGEEEEPEVKSAPKQKPAPMSAKRLAGAIAQITTDDCEIIEYLALSALQLAEDKKISVLAVVPGEETAGKYGLHRHRLPELMSIPVSNINSNALRTLPEDFKNAYFNLIIDGKRYRGLLNDAEDEVESLIEQGCIEAKDYQYGQGKKKEIIPSVEITAKGKERLQELRGSLGVDDEKSAEHRIMASAKRGSFPR